MSFSINELVVLALVLVLGWLLGLASRSGGAKYRDEAASERARADAAEARIEASNTRIAELERNSHPVGAATAGSIAAAARGGRDDLALIRGIGHRGEVQVNDAGIHRFSQLASLSDHDAAALEGRLGAQPGTIAREEWREQAATLAKDPAAHKARWGGAA
jgi:predicted flap endonuclease-1-like 5' DNA nuclease